MSDELPVYTIYRNPRDFPGWFVVRRSIVRGGQVIMDPNVRALARSLNEARTRIPLGLALFPRRDEDDPVIVECWM